MSHPQIEALRRTWQQNRDTQAHEIERIAGLDRTPELRERIEQLADLQDLAQLVLDQFGNLENIANDYHRILRKKEA